MDRGIRSTTLLPSDSSGPILPEVADIPKFVNLKVDVKLPGIVGIAGTWEPDKSEIRAAWELYVEMVSRTPLGGFSPQEGSVREALTSIYSLFDSTRGILRNYGPSVAQPKRGRKMSFGYLTISMLNLVLRPLLTEWHPRLQAWERANPSLREDEWPDRRDFLKALSETKDLLSQYASIFAKVAKVPELTEKLNDTSATA